MALEVQAYYNETTLSPLPRVEPEEGPGAVVVRESATGTALLKKGTAVYNIPGQSSIVAKIVPNGTAEQKAVYGILLHDVQLVSGSGAAAIVMIRGEAHYDDIKTAATYAGTAAELRTVLRDPTIRDKGLIISGLDAIHSTLST